MERVQATDAARNLLHSNIAKALLEENRLPTSRLRIQVSKIDSGVKRREALFKHEHRLFNRQSLLNNIEPTLVVERTSVPDIPKDSSLKSNTHEETTPHYMTDLDKNRHKNMSTSLPQVDMFEVKFKSKRNLWENKYKEDDSHSKYKSVILHSAPLTQQETQDLNKGCAAYRASTRVEEKLRRKHLNSKKESRYHLAKSFRAKPTRSSSVFLTQLEAMKRSLSSKKRSSTRNSTAPALPQAALPDADTEIEKLQEFKKLREQQKKLYYRYL